MLGESIEVLIDAGSSPGETPSTIVDVTGDTGRVLRLGAVPLARLNEIVEPFGTEILDEG
jgi:tRNA A37 threonylcarbamoyladenosine synthetase subunit TsaC/SUA5/YrdC